MINWPIVGCAHGLASHVPTVQDLEILFCHLLLRINHPLVFMLIRSTIYPHLRDHPSVLKYGHVRGMTADVFFLDHDHPEGGAGEGNK